MLSPYPSLFLPLMRRRTAHDGHVVDDESELMVEGFPRSGNTFAVAAFQFAQERPLRIARHLHAAAHVKEGISRGLPVIVVCRDPADAAVSMVIRHPETTVRQALRQYVTFHRPLLGSIDDLVVAPFETVTEDFGRVIDDVNRRFGTSFRPFEHTPSNVERVFAEVDAMDRSDNTRRSGDPADTVGRPADERAARKAVVAPQLSEPRTSTLLDEARALHHRMIAGR
jgi:hypothetical protein